MDVRSIWQHEALAFTPWLADNLHLLGEALGKNLEILQQEAQVGRFSLDILARDIGTDVRVAIENQLEETDHSHLGQLLTYAAGFDARVIVWVTPSFNDEHRAAIDWLNRSTTEDIEFYGVELRTIRIDDSLPAPEFLPVAFPNGWSKELQVTPRQLSPLNRRFREFFQPLVDELREMGLTSQGRAHARSFQRLPSEITGVEYGVGLFTPNDALVYVVIATGDRELNGRVLGTLQGQSDQIESCLEADWKWDRLPGPVSVALRHDGSIEDSLETMEEVRSWMLAQLPKFKEVLEPRLAQLLSDQQSDAPRHTPNEPNPANERSSHLTSTHAGHAHQQQRALELIDRINRDINLVDRHGGYDLAKPGSTRIGHVRFNIGGRDAGNYRVYAYEPFSDPRGLFDNDSGGGQGRRGWTCLAGPGNEEDIRYVVDVLESSYDQK